MCDRTMDQTIDQTIDELCHLADRASNISRQPSGARYVLVETSELEALRWASAHLRYCPTVLKETTP